MVAEKKQPAKTKQQGKEKAARTCPVASVTYIYMRSFEYFIVLDTAYS